MRNLLLSSLLLLAFPAVHAQFNHRLDAIQEIQQGDIQLQLGNSEQALLRYTTAIHC